MILVMCIGNEMNGDDGIGPYIAENFPDVKDFKVVNCETVPENFVYMAKMQIGLLLLMLSIWIYRLEK